MPTYSITASGPSTPLAYLRALWLKRAIADARRGSRRHARPGTGRLAAETGIDLLTTDAGYDTATALVSATASLAWHGTAVIIRGIGRALIRTGRLVTKGVGLLAPKTAARLESRIDKASQSVSASWSGTDAALRTVGSVFRAALAEQAVRRTTTIAAQVMSLLMFVHVVTGGAAAFKLVTLAPWTIDAVIAATNPTTALFGVLGVTGSAMLFALARLVATAEAEEEPDGDPSAAEAMPDASGIDARVFEWQPGSAHRHADRIADVDLQPMVAEVTDDLEAIAKSVQVEVQSDGSVVVHGIPDTVPPDLGLAVAEIAREAVEQQLRRVLMVRPVPTRNDRRLLSKVAREAIVSEAGRRQREVIESVA